MIRSPELYDATYAAISKRIAEVPILTLAAGRSVYRSTDIEDLSEHVSIDPDPLDPVKARRVAEILRKMYSGEADHRWSGSRPDGRKGLAGLYAALDICAAGGELFAYLDTRATNRPSTLEAGIGQELDGDQPYSPWTATRFPGLIVRKRIFEYRLSESVKCADVRRTPSGDWADILRELDQDPNVRGALQRAGYASVDEACLDDEDYSFTRAVGHAIRDNLSKLPALFVSSARIEEATTLHVSGYNIVFLGVDGDDVKGLDPVRQFASVMDNKGSLKHIQTRL